eukprot:gnl/Chilomastix_cuspidata/6902.p1 GENE.gnl/Chilomastix_cuspidata/6902~~gnl/Chilomastix_cuspidata/6902.p1  ORF type:complete len:478 (+),score=8.53 gnl/Chilomastix_cuspidata/6902:34-1467(+)
MEPHPREYILTLLRRNYSRNRHDRLSIEELTALKTLREKIGEGPFEQLSKTARLQVKQSITGLKRNNKYNDTNSASRHVSIMPSFPTAKQVRLSNLSVRFATPHVPTDNIPDLKLRIKALEKENARKDALLAQHKAPSAQPAPLVRRALFATRALCADLAELRAELIREMSSLMMLAARHNAIESPSKARPRPARPALAPSVAVHGAHAAQRSLCATHITGLSSGMAVCSVVPARATARERRAAAFQPAFALTEAKSLDAMLRFVAPAHQKLFLGGNFCIITNSGSLESFFTGPRSIAARVCSSFLSRGGAPLPVVRVGALAFDLDTCCDVLCRPGIAAPSLAPTPGPDGRPLLSGMTRVTIHTEMELQKLLNIIYTRILSFRSLSALLIVDLVGSSSGRFAVCVCPRIPGPTGLVLKSVIKLLLAQTARKERLSAAPLSQAFFLLLNMFEASSPTLLLMREPSLDSECAKLLQTVT